MVFSRDQNPLGRNSDHVDMPELNSGFRRGEWRLTATILMAGTLAHSMWR